MQPSVILVDRHDNPTGTATKIVAHQQPLLHRAFSVLVFDSKQRLILQKRADEKYHSAGLWSNTCCSHPGAAEPIQLAAEPIQLAAEPIQLAAEPIQLAAESRLQQEMGFTTALEKIGTLHYELELAGGLFEYEFNHVFCGTSNSTPLPDPTEVSDWKALTLKETADLLKANPGAFSAWFPLILERLAAPLQHYLTKTPEYTHGE